MDIFDCLIDECIQVGSSASNKKELLAEIAKLAKKSSLLESLPESAILQALTDREDTGTTGFENGLAIPHCRLKEVSEFVVGLIIVPEGIDFEAYDGKPTKIVFFIIAPEKDRDLHIRILSTISRTLATEAVRDELISKTDPIDLKETFLRYTRDDIKADETTQKSFFHIFLQHDEYINDILQVLTSLSASVAVIEAKDAGAYLHKLPLFASLWSEEQKGFHILILGTINKKLANELIRNIDTIVGGLDGKTGTLITIQDVILTRGSLH